MNGVNFIAFLLKLFANRIYYCMYIRNAYNEMDDDECECNYVACCYVCDELYGEGKCNAHCNIELSSYKIFFQPVVYIVVIHFDCFHDWIVLS